MNETRVNASPPSPKAKARQAAQHRGSRGHRYEARPGVKGGRQPAGEGRDGAAGECRLAGAKEAVSGPGRQVPRGTAGRGCGAGCGWVPARNGDELASEGTSVVSHAR